MLSLKRENYICLHILSAGMHYELFKSCRGFGTVRFASPETANGAVDAMNNTEIGGRVVSVRIDSFA